MTISPKWFKWACFKFLVPFYNLLLSKNAFLLLAYCIFVILFYDCMKKDQCSPVALVRIFIFVCNILCFSPFCLSTSTVHFPLPFMWGSFYRFIMYSVSCISVLHSLGLPMFLYDIVLSKKIDKNIFSYA